MGNKGIARKVFSYGVNYFGRIGGNLYQYGTARVPEIVANGTEKGLNLGHPYAALAFAGLDIVAENSNILKDSSLYRLSKVGGTLGFSFLVGKDLVNFIKGDYSDLKNLPFHLLMAGSLGADAKDLYKDSKNNVLSDFVNIGSTIVSPFKRKKKSE